MNCRYCGEDKKLIKAHVIPEAFFRRLRVDQDPPRLLTNKENEYPKRAPVGVYDSEILCETCEVKFGDWDNYAQYLLGEELRNCSPITANGNIAGYEVTTYDYELLKLFFISLLWRASVSVHPFYSKIKLGPYEAKAKQFLEQRNPGSADDFSVTLAKFDHPLGETIFDPYPEKWDGINYYRFYLGSYVAHIKTDKRIVPEPHSLIILAPNRSLVIIKRNFERSKELPLIKKIAMAANNRLQPTSALTRRRG